MVPTWAGDRVDVCDRKVRSSREPLTELASKGRPIPGAFATASSPAMPWIEDHRSTHANHPATPAFPWRLGLTGFTLHHAAAWPLVRPVTGPLPTDRTAQLSDAALGAFHQRGSGVSMALTELEEESSEAP